MCRSRRQFLRAAAGVAALPLLPRASSAKVQYPARPVHVVVGFPAGTGPDFVARITAKWLSEHLGQQFVVEDRPGAASNIATEAVVRATADGYTLLHITVANAINARLNNEALFARDIAPVASIARASFIVVVNPSFTAADVPQLIAYARAHPETISIGSSGIGSAPYLAAELFKVMSRIDVLHIPYAGTPQAITELLAERVQVVFADPSAIGLVKSGKLRALAVTAAARQEILPDLPPLGDFLPGYEASTWHGIGAPKGVPGDIVESLNKEVNAGLADTDVKARLAMQGFTVMGGSAADFGRLIADETAKWARMTRAAGGKAD
jgi:tripartite-type tricarboxylate transporter receptor subunit TctC